MKRRSSHILTNHVFRQFSWNLYLQQNCGGSAELFSLKCAFLLTHRLNYILCFSVFPLNWSVFFSNRHYQPVVDTLPGKTACGTDCMTLCDTSRLQSVWRTIEMADLSHPVCKWKVPHSEARSHVCEPCRPSAFASPENHIWQAINKRGSGCGGHPLQHMSLWWH